MWVKEHRPECVSAIGLVAIAWTRVENEMAMMLGGIVGAAQVGVGGNIDWITHCVMENLETIRVRQKVLSSILSKLLKHSDLMQEWEKVDKDLSGRARERNIIVHSEWAWIENFPNHVLQINKDGSKNLWDERDFMAAYHRIKLLEERLHKFMLKVWDEIKVGRVSL